MTRTRYRDDSDSHGLPIAGVLAGALAGLAVGLLLSNKLGGLAGIRALVRKRFARFGHGKAGALDLDALREFADEAFADLDPLDGAFDDDDLEEDEAEDQAAAALEARVLAAFEADPVFRDRAVDIGAVDQSVIELAGWVHSKEERRRATALARRVAGVGTVVNELLVGDPDVVAAGDLAGR